MSRSCAPNPQSLALYLRIARGYSQKELSWASGLTCNDICRIEQGNMALGIGKLIRLARTLETTPDALFHNDFSVLSGHALTYRRKKRTCRERLHRYQRRCEQIGDRGEAWVAQLEAERLKGSAYEGLVNTGYANERKPCCDMVSFDLQTGQPVVIEVKSTTGDADEVLYFSEGELQLLRRCAAEDIPYELHRVYWVDDPARRAQRVYTAEEVLQAFDIVPNHYIFRPKRGENK